MVERLRLIYGGAGVLGEWYINTVDFLFVQCSLVFRVSIVVAGFSSSNHTLILVLHSNFGRVEAKADLIFCLMSFITVAFYAYAVVGALGRRLLYSLLHLRLFWRLDI